MPDEMFFSEDAKCLRRGKRREARTPTCRPCLVWPKDEPEMTFQGVVVDVNPYGMRIRMLDSLPPGTAIMVQLMRDEDFTIPLAAPVEGLIVRNKETAEGLYDHGIQLRLTDFRRSEPSVPLRPIPRPIIPLRRGGQSRMHIIDITVGNRRTRRTGR
ncbi:MAG TPA: hypothetical protein PKY35_11815 [Candidatus Hydrogenedentes bacterium]|nr:hypothetical protein [Candidatus Hydrogenedentota bacterium]HOL77704.1 hypothetical protein [Candidatus Hydrogenedentota bacterium]HPO86827.1 hypothetical protein [Candidatus Hydrogenedentota bacterium]